MSLLLTTCGGMQCPACNSDTHRVLRTVRGVRHDRRRCVCSECHTVFDTVAKIDTVYTDTGPVPVTEYQQDTHRDTEYSQGRCDGNQG